MAPVFIKRYGGSKGVKDLDAYGFIIDQTNDDIVIEYVGINKDYNPAYMDYNTGVFNYGGWEDVFFIKNTNPCVVINTGEIYKYLNKDNFFVDESNNSSTESIVRGNYGHCTMIEFPKIYWKTENLKENLDVVWISDKKVDNYFECYANKNIYNEEIDKFYVSAFESIQSGSTVLSCARALYPIGIGSAQNTLSTYVNYLKNKNNEYIWSMMKRCDKTIIIFLLILMSKSIDCQEKYGNGNVAGFNNSVNGKNAITPGSMVTEGMFKGYNVTSGKGVKVFGIENFWGNMNKQVRCSCVTNDNLYIKMVEGIETKDSYFGVSESDFDFKFGINDVTNIEMLKTKLIKKMHVGNYGFFPKELAESDSEVEKYFQDAAYFVKVPSGVYALEEYGGRNAGEKKAGMNYTSDSQRHNISLNDNFLMSLKPRASVVNI